MPSTLSSSSSLSSSLMSNSLNLQQQQQKCYGKIIVIKRNGQDSASFELADPNYVFGRAEKCDIRIQLASIGEEHCRIFPEANGRFALIQNLSSAGIMINDVQIKDHKEHPLKNGDVIMIVERSFRYENPFWREDEEKTIKEAVGSETPSKAHSTPLKPQATPSTKASPFTNQDIHCFSAKTATPSKHSSPKLTTPTKVVASPMIKEQMTITPTKQSLTPKFTDRPAEECSPSQSAKKAFNVSMVTPVLSKPEECNNFEIAESKLELSLPRSPAKFVVDSTPQKLATCLSSSRTPSKTPNAMLLSAVTPVSQTKDIGMIIPVSDEKNDATATATASVVTVTPQSETKKAMIIGSAGYSALMNSCSQGKEKEKDKSAEQPLSPLLQRGIIDHEISASPKLSPRIKLIAVEAEEEEEEAIMIQQESPVVGKTVTNALIIDSIGDLLTEPQAKTESAVGTEGAIETKQQEEEELVFMETIVDQQPLIAVDQDVIQELAEANIIINNNPECSNQLQPEIIEPEEQSLSSLVVQDQDIADQTVVVVDLAPMGLPESTVVVEEADENMEKVDSEIIANVEADSVPVVEDTAELTEMVQPEQQMIVEPTEIVQPEQQTIVEPTEMVQPEQQTIVEIQPPFAHVSESQEVVTENEESLNNAEPDSNTPSTPRRSARLQKTLTATPNSKLSIKVAIEQASGSSTKQTEATVGQSELTVEKKKESEETVSTITQSARRRSTRTPRLGLSSAQISRSTGSKQPKASASKPKSKTEQREEEEGTNDNSPSIQAFRRSGRTKGIVEEDKENEQQQPTNLQARRQSRTVKRPSEVMVSTTDHEDGGGPATSEAEVTIRKSARTARVRQ